MFSSFYEGWVRICGGSQLRATKIELAVIAFVISAVIYNVPKAYRALRARVKKVFPPIGLT
jgi:hypothetical protein